MSDNLFDYVNSISYNKNYMIDQDVESEKNYKHFFVNKAFSYNADTIFYANAMNTNHHIDKKMQYDYLFHSIPKKKRFGKWHKNSDTNREAIDAIKHFYNYNEAKASQALQILDSEDIKKILNAWSNINCK